MIVRKAIVPLAGLGTRLFPASHAVKKELFPVVGPDGIARAMLHYHLLELAAADIEDVCLVVQPGDEATARDYFFGADERYLDRLTATPALRREAEEMRALGERIRFAIQYTQDGYGHAVYQTRAFADDEPVLLCLGDHLFRGRRMPPSRELADHWAISGGRSVSAVCRIGPGELGGYGTIAGMRRPDDPRIIEVTKIIEKPHLNTARDELHVGGLPADTWLGWFGIHLLAPSIYDILEELIEQTPHGREVQLTDAQEIQREREGYLALEITDAERFDFGTPADYVASLSRFARGSS